MMAENNHLDIENMQFFLNSIYYQGWDDCLDVILSMLAKQNSSLVKSKVENLQVYVKGKKFEYFRSDLKVIDDLF